MGLMPSMLWAYDRVYKAERKSIQQINTSIIDSFRICVNSNYGGGEHTGALMHFSATLCLSKSE
jgi:hypothetical protein